MSPDNQIILAYCSVESAGSKATFYAEKYLYDEKVDKFYKENDAN